MTHISSFFNDNPHHYYLSGGWSFSSTAVFVFQGGSGAGGNMINHGYAGRISMLPAPLSLEATATVHYDIAIGNLQFFLLHQSIALQMLSI
jgi:hypothetical protein